MYWCDSARGRNFHYEMVVVLYVFCKEAQICAAHSGRVVVFAKVRTTSFISCICVEI